MYDVYISKSKKGALISTFFNKICMSVFRANFGKSFKSIKTDYFPVIIVWLIHIIINFINDAENYLFVDKNIAAGSSTNWSYPSRPSHLDHILITNELFDEFANTESSVETIRVEEKLDEGWSEYKNYISDHRPVGLRLKFSQ